MKALSRRLHRLEKEWVHTLEAERRKAERSNSSAAQWIAKKRDEFGFVRDPKESLIESLARALVRLERIAGSGVPPEACCWAGIDADIDT